MQIEIDGNIYDIFIEKKHIKNTYLRVKEDLNIYITTSYLTPNYLIKKFVNDNIGFIRKQLDKQEKRLEKKLDYYYLGEIINVVIINNIKKTSFENNTLYVKNKSEISKWYKKQTKEIFQNHLDEVYNIFSERVPYPSLVIRKMTTRWGVCNTKDKRVTLNLELMKKPIYCLDYVIMHELSHLIHQDHSKEFWALVEENCKEYKKIKKILKE